MIIIILSKVKGICKGDSYVHSLLSYYLSRLKMTSLSLYDWSAEVHVVVREDESNL